jgi:hypothetical protein
MSEVMEMEEGYGGAGAAGSRFTMMTGRSSAVRNWAESDAKSACAGSCSYAGKLT